MSMFRNPFKVFHNIFENFTSWWKNSDIGKAITTDAENAVSELEKLSAQDAEQAGLTIGTAALQGLATGGVAGAFAAGVAAAPAALKVAENDISTRTVNTLVTSVVNQLHDQLQQAVEVEPAPVSPPVA